MNHIQGVIKNLMKLLSLLLLSSGVYSQSITSSPSSVYTDASLKTKTSYTFYASMSSFTDGCTRTVSSNLIKVKMNLGDDYLFGKTAFTSTLTLNIEPFKVVGTTATTLVKTTAPALAAKSITLSISQTSPEAYAEIDIATWFSGNAAALLALNQFKVTVTSYTGPTDAIIASYIKVSLEHNVSYTIDASGLTATISTLTAPSNPATFVWSLPTSDPKLTISDIPVWQFQLLRLYNTDESKTSETSITADVNWDNALSIFSESTDRSISLNISEGQGYYIWRVRPIGNKYSGGIADSRNAGKWSYTDNNVTLSLNGSTTDPLNTFFYSDQDININWIYGRTFSEGDASKALKVSEAKVYANGLCMAKQQQAINQSEGFVVANQTVYNYTGMPAVQSMPVPIASKKTFKFIDKLLTDNSGKIYRAGDFDSDTYYQSPVSVDSSATSYYNYYSDNATVANTFIPSSQGYPIAISEYKNDGSGRPSETSGVGKAFKIGGGHTTTYSYTCATDEQLIKLFGDEAPKGSKVYKVCTTDPNGALTVSYINYKGQTIATCNSANDNKASTLLDNLSTHPSTGKGEYNFTLFYYGRNGNLVKTVAPKGVLATSVDRSTHPSNTFETEYEYNFMGQMTRKKTPDGGETFYYYDDLKRLRFSQNAKQKAIAYYSYVKYDNLNRIIEAGESNASSSSFSSTTNLNDKNFPTKGNDVTYTVYSKPVTSISYNGEAQSYLRNRISYVFSDVDGDTSTTKTDQARTYYSYDPHGNVKWLIQDVPGLGKKTIAYEYDLINNCVKKIKYNEGKVDEFYERYTYDADKRIILVETSTDNKIWDKDAQYSFYKHGPLKREEIGEDKIQGLDYTYTLQGWLKTINHPSLLSKNDPGNDTTNFASDVYATTLGYYADDFYKKSSSLNANTSNKYYYPSATGLYNGSITSWGNNFISNATTNAFAQKGLTCYAFKYDELYRLTKADNNIYASSTSTWPSASTPNYDMSISYDDNGNILTMMRKGYGSATAIGMDDLTYNYTPNTNKLKYIKDAVTNNSAYTVDIDDQSSTSSSGGNYFYDDMGELIQDKAEGITKIEWNVQGKVKKVTKSDGSTTSFTYDAMGNRVKKEAITKTTSKTTYYVRDAKGAVVSMYEEASVVSGTTTTKTLSQKEVPIMGGKRIGNYNSETKTRTTTNGVVADVPAKTSTGIYYRTLGKRVYELNDHLGDVRATFTDIKLPGVSSPKPGKFAADITSINNYYAYGMAMPGSTYSTDNYRYGFNGMEKDNEIKGSNNSYDFNARLYDPRVGRWLSRDPLESKYPDLSPYEAMANNPIMFVDPDGRDIIKCGLTAFQKAAWAEYLKTPSGKEVLARYDKSETEDVYIYNVSDPANWQADDPAAVAETVGDGDGSSNTNTPMLGNIDISKSGSKSVSIISLKQCNDDPSNLENLFLWAYAIGHEFEAHIFGGTGDSDKDHRRFGNGSIGVSGLLIRMPAREGSKAYYLKQNLLVNYYQARIDKWQKILADPNSTKEQKYNAQGNIDMDTQSKASCQQKINDGQMKDVTDQPGTPESDAVPQE